MFKFFSANNTKNYVNNLSDMIHSYNNSIHRAIKMTPTQATGRPKKMYTSLN